MSTDTDTYIINISTGVNREQRRIPLDNVEAFFSNDKYVLARLTNGAEVFPSALQAPQETFLKSSSKTVTLRDIEGWLARIGRRNFVRVHRGWLANMQHITTYRITRTGKLATGGGLLTNGDRVIPVSRRELIKTKHAFRQGVFA